jgi:Domain of Unknown Function (DUF1080)
MIVTRITLGAAVCLALLLGLSLHESSGQQDKKKKEKKPETKVWTSASDPTLPADYKFQGEYVGEDKEGNKFGCQVIALAGGEFQAVLLPGGLPGAGWDGKNKILMDGNLRDDAVFFKPAEGKRKYLAQKPDEFSATSKFPPVGQVECKGKIESGILRASMGLKDLMLKKTERKSPTIGLKPPAGAVVLFDGTGTEEWNGGRLDKATGLLNTDGKDIVSKKKFNNYLAHVEFMLPFRPEGRGQGRGNSGFYQVQHYEVQILDSFGLEGKDNECGGIYTKVTPKLNMCLPPLTWQTYDIDFTNAVADSSGKVVKKARATVKLNGVVIHDDVEIAGPTGGHRKDQEGTPGSALLQGHGNPLQFRNIWFVEKK